MTDRYLPSVAKNTISREEFAQTGQQYEQVGALRGYHMPRDRDDDTYAQDMRAYLTRKEYEDAATRFHPVEDQLINDVTNTELLDKRLSEIRADTGRYYESAKASESRRNARYGITKSAEEQQQEQYKSGMQSALSQQDAANNTRTHIYDRNMDVIGGSGTRQALSDF